MCLLHYISGAFTHQPEELRSKIGKKTGDLIRRVFDDIDPARLVDYHTHVAGTGTDDSGAFVNQKMLTWSHPFHRFKFKVYLSAGAVGEAEHADRGFVERLARLIGNIESHGKHRLLAIDKNYNRDGTPNLGKTEFYVPNGYVFALAERHPGCLGDRS
jgi:hypothetical protein